MKVRQAHLHDWPAIALMKQRFFSEWGLPAQDRTMRSPFHWSVAEHEGRVVACLCTVADYNLREITCFDYYHIGGRIGIRGASALKKDIEQTADRLACSIFTMTDPSNVAMQNAEEKRGYEAVAILRCRKPQIEGALKCQPQHCPQ